MSQTMREALEWTAAALQEVFRTNHNCSEHDRIVIGGSSATVREILNRADAALSAPSSEQAQQGAEPEWAAEAKKTLNHLSAFLQRFNVPHAVAWRDWIDNASKHFAALAGAAQPAVGVTERVADLKRLIGKEVNYPGTPRSAAWVADVFAKIDSIAALAGAAQGAEPVEWKPVPVKATSAMLDAVIGNDESLRVTRFGFEDAYEAMIAAAPQPPTGTEKKA